MSKWNAGVPLIVALVSVTFTGVIASTVLKCGQQCHCWTQQKQILKEYRIICNETNSQPMKLTEEIFNGSESSDVFQLYVRIQDGGEVTVTEGFIRSWKQFGSCSLDVWNVNHLMLPQIHPTPIEGDEWHHVFAGIGILNTTLDEIPSNIFSGKTRAGLRLHRSHVGIVKQGIFSDVKILKYLQVEDSYIGIIQGSSEAGKLQIEENEEDYSILIKNSVVGEIKAGALNATSKTVQQILLDDVTFGQVQTGAIMVSGVNLILNNVKVADMQRESLHAEGRGYITIKNSHIIAQPGALTHLPCSLSDHHISANKIVTYSAPMDLQPISNYLESNETSALSPGSNTSAKFSLAVLASEELRTVLHQSCIRYNLPQWVLDNNCWISEDSPNPSKLTSHILYFGVYSFAAISIIAIIVVVILICILLNTRSRRRPRDGPTVVMSDLQDPIYEDASTLFLTSLPPAVPPPVALHYSDKDTSNADHCSSIFYRSGCGGESSGSKIVENDYTTMH